MTSETSGSTPRPLDRLGERVRNRLDSLPPTLRRVALFLNDHRIDVLSKSAMELGDAIGTSDATIVRAAKALGFDGLPDLKKYLAGTMGTASNPALDLGRTLAVVDADTERSIEHVLVHQADAARDLLKGDARTALSAAVELLHGASTIAIFGLGPSAHMANYMAFLLGRHGRQSFALDRGGLGLADQMLRLRRGDALLMLAYGPPYVEAETALEDALAQKIPVVLVTDMPDGPLAAAANVILCVPRSHRDGIALHGTTLICLESILVGLASMEQHGTLSTLNRLNTLRDRLSRSRTRRRIPSPAKP